MGTECRSRISSWQQVAIVAVEAKSSSSSVAAVMVVGAALVDKSRLEGVVGCVHSYVSTLF